MNQASAKRINFSKMYKMRNSLGYLIGNIENMAVEEFCILNLVH